MISMRRASKTYYQNTPTLHQISLEWKPGDFLFIVGDSGAGKTTLLKMLSGEEKPSEGDVLLHGTYPVGKLSSNILQLRRTLGIVYQDLRLLHDRSAYENIVLPLYFGRAGTGVAPVSPTDPKAKKLVYSTAEDVGISKKALYTPLKELSGGEKQRIAIARAIINKPDFLIADEPTGSLDHDHTWSIMDLFQKLNLKGMSIIVATHDQDIVRKVRKQTGHLSGGRLRLDNREGICIF